MLHACKFVSSFGPTIVNTTVVPLLPPELNITKYEDFKNTENFKNFFSFLMSKWQTYALIILVLIILAYVCELKECWRRRQRSSDEQVADKFAITQKLKTSTDLRTYSHDTLEKRIAGLPVKDQESIRKVHEDRRQKYLDEKDSRQTIEEFHSVEELYALTEKKKAVLLLGFGTSEYINIQEAKKHVDQVVRELNKKYGENKWFFVYGGDKYEKLKLDLAYSLNL